MGLIEAIKRFCEPEKCEICGEKNSLFHEFWCFENTFGYNLSEKIEPSTRIYFMKQREKYGN